MSERVARRVGRFRRFGFCLISVIAAALPQAGCVTPPEGIKTVEGREQDDIPVPKDFELQRSYIPSAAAETNFRSWHGYYRGPGQMGDIAAWYVTEMRKHGWTFKGMESSTGGRKLNFLKGDETSGIEIYSELDAKAGTYVSVVHAEVHPRGTEDLSLEEHLRSLRSTEIEARPASFAESKGTARPAPSAAAIETGARSRSSERKAPERKEAAAREEVSRGVPPRTLEIPRGVPPRTPLSAPRPGRDLEDEIESVENGDR